MTVTAVRKDAEALSMTVDAEFEATPERVWQLWADPRQLERWWGPPGYPATFTELDLRPGGRASYYMTTPEGERPRGYWDVVEVDPPRRLEVRDGFAKEDGSPNEEMGSGEMIVTVEHPTAGPIREIGCPIKVGAPPPLRPAPRLGAHADEVLDEAGVGADERAALRAAGGLA